MSIAVVFVSYIHTFIKIERLTRLRPATVTVCDEGPKDEVQDNLKGQLCVEYLRRSVFKAFNSSISHGDVIYLVSVI